eukprot:5549793-Ditylum_brightwellii.AAC.1
MIKLNDYLVQFPVLDGVTATKISCKQFLDVLEDGIMYQWKLEFKKEGFNLRSSTLKEFLNMYVCLEEAELQTLLRKKIAHSGKEHDKDRIGNNKTSPSRVTRDVTVQENAIKASKRKRIAKPQEAHSA